MAAISAVIPGSAASTGGIVLSPDLMAPLIAVAALAVLVVTVGAAKARAVLALRARGTTDAGWAALVRSNLVAEFDLDGTVRWTNERFLDTLGYRLDEIAGLPDRSHDMGVSVSRSSDPAFWAKLAAGEHQTGEYRRVAKDGRVVWLQSTYTPVLDENGRPIRVLEVATDVTVSKLAAADSAARLAALDRSQAVIEFATDGTVLEANDVFLALRRPVLAEHAAHTPLGHIQHSPHLIDAASAPCGAQKFPFAASCKMSLSSVRSEIARRNRAFSFSRSFIRRA